MAAPRAYACISEYQILLWKGFVAWMLQSRAPGPSDRSLHSKFLRTAGCKDVHSRDHMGIGTCGFSLSPPIRFNTGSVSSHHNGATLCMSSLQVKEHITPRSSLDCIHQTLVMAG